MSYVTIFGFDKEGNSFEIGDINNAWLGAMAVWSKMSEKYLRKDFSIMGPKEVWNLFDSEKISHIDRVVLGSTFDKVIVKKENFEDLIKCFNEFEGNTNLKEQAKLIQENMNKTDYIGFHQNSVSCEFFFDYNLENEEHWFLYDDVNEVENKK